MGKLVGPETESWLANAMLQYPASFVEAEIQGTNIGLSWTFRITGDWQQENAGESYYCEARPFIFDPETKKYALDETGDSTRLYSPADLDQQPSDYSSGDVVRAIYNGNWEIVGATGGSGTPTLSGVVMEAIELTPDVTSDPEDYTFGKIRIVGKEYPTTDENGQPIGVVFDDCCCLDLGKDPTGEDHQQLIKGDIVTVHGPYQRKNPDYDSEDEESEEPEYLEYYKADVIEEYRIKLDSDVQWNTAADQPTPGNTTITRTDSDDNVVVMFASGEVVTQGFKVFGNAEAYIVRNEKADNGRRLFVVGGRCQQKVE